MQAKVLLSRLPEDEGAGGQAQLEVRASEEPGTTSLLLFPNTHLLPGFHFDLYPDLNLVALAYQCGFIYVYQRAAAFYNKGRIEGIMNKVSSQRSRVVILCRDSSTHSCVLGALAGRGWFLHRHNMQVCTSALSELKCLICIDCERGIRRRGEQHFQNPQGCIAAPNNLSPYTHKDTYMFSARLSALIHLSTHMKKSAHATI